MKIIDCFPYNGEKHILEIRLNNLKDLVSEFLIIEAASTHSGKPKPYYLEQHLNDFKEFIPKIRYIKLGYYNFGSSWANYVMHRNIFYSFLDDLNSNDLCIVGDLDEMINVPVVKPHIDQYESAISPMLRFYHYKFNLYCPGVDWWGPAIISKKEIDTFYPSKDQNSFVNREIGFEKIRNIRDKFKRIDCGGWHITYCLSNEGIRNKLASFAHAELDRPEINNPDHIEQSIKNLTSLNPETASWKFEKVPLDSINAPDYVIRNREKFKEFILD